MDIQPASTATTLSLDLEAEVSRPDTHVRHQGARRSLQRHRTQRLAQGLGAHRPLLVCLRLSLQPETHAASSGGFNLNIDARELRRLVAALGLGHETGGKARAIIVQNLLLLRLGTIEIRLELPEAASQSRLEVGDILEIRIQGPSAPSQRSAQAPWSAPGTPMIGDPPSLPASQGTTAQTSTLPGTSSASARVEALNSSIQTQANARVLQVGQVLNARILEVSSQGEIRLEAGNQTLKASLPSNLSGLELRPGQNVQLQVLSLGNPPLIRLLLPGTEESAQNQLLRQLLPRQAGMNALLQQLGQLFSNDQQASTGLDKPLIQTLQLLSSQQLDSSVRQTLVQVVQQLANQQTSPQLQQALSQLATQLGQAGTSQLQQAPGQATTQTGQSGNSQLQQAINQLAQLASQSTSGQSGTSQLQQTLNQLAQLASQTQDYSQPGSNQLQQAINQLAQLASQNSGSQPGASQGPSSSQLQQALKQVAQLAGHQVQPSNQQTNAQTSPQATQLNPQLAAGPTGSTVQQAKEVEELLRLLNEHSLDHKQLGPEVIRGLFLGSGLFLEAGLAQSRTPRANDLKSLLLRMVTLLQSSSHQGGLQQLLQRFVARNKSNQGAQETLQTQLLTQIRKATEGALAKLELQQLQSLPQKNDESRQSWHFALTLNEEAKFREVEAHIERERPRKRQQAEERWNVELHFDFEASGPMDARIQLQKEQIQVNFWASRIQTLERVRQLLPRLESALTKAGLEVTHLAAWPGEKPRPRDGERNPAASSGLVNLRA